MNLPSIDRILNYSAQCNLFFAIGPEGGMTCIDGPWAEKSDFRPDNPPDSTVANG